MKKQYVCPAINMVRVEMTQMIAASTLQKNSTKKLGDGDEGLFLGRETGSGNLWDDED